MNLNVIRALTIRSTVEGADKTRADLKGIQDAHQGVVRSSDTSAKGQLSLADAVSKAERRFNTSIRAQQDFEKVQRQMNMAVAQNPALQARANAVLALAATHFDQASKGQRVFSTAMQAANDNVRQFAQSAGPAGSILAAMGPGGLVAAAGIGAAVIALHQMLTAATNLADRAGKLKDFAETTGFTVIELQALEKAGAQVGVSAESVSRGLERFSVQMAEVRLRTGETFEKMVAINPVLARQVAEAESLSKAYELVSKAIKGAGLEQGNQLARAFFGRSGVEQTRLMRVVGGDAGMKGIIDDLNKVDAITAQQADRWDTLGDKIAENMKAAKQNIASIFTEPVLQAAERFSKAFLDLSREMKQFEVSERLKAVMDFFSNPITQGAMAGALAGARGGLVGAGIGAVAGGGAAALFSQADTQQTAADIAKLRFELEQLELVKAGASRKVLESVDPAQVQQYAAILERTNKRIAEIQSQMPTQLPRITVTGKAQNDNYVSDAEAAAAADIRRRDAIVGLYNEMAQRIATLGAAATMWERYELGVSKADAALARNKLTAEDHARVLVHQKQQLELSLGVADMAKVTEDRLAQIREVASKAGLTEEQQRLAVQIAINEAKDRERHAWRRANPEMAMAVDYAESLAKSLVAVAMGAGSISDAFKSLSGTLASDAVRSLFKMEFLTAGLQAAGAAITAGLGAFFDDGKQKELEKAKLAFADMGAEVRNFNAAADGFELSQFVTAIQQITRTGLELIKAAMAAGDVAAAIQLIHAGVRQINNTVDQFIRPRGDTVADQIANENAQARQLIAELDALNKQYNLGLNRTNEILAAAAEHIAEIQKKAQEEIERRQQTFQDRVFAAANDNATLEGQLAAQARQFERERLEETKTGGEAMVDLLAAQQAEEFALRKSFGDKAIEETKRVEQARLDEINNTAKGVVDFIAGLQSGPNATVSPTTNLANTLALYNANLPLAQSGNIEAQQKFVSLADNLEKAARAVFASGQGYQDIRNQIISEGLALPAVQQATDPVVAALANVLAAINVGNATQALDATLQGVIKSAIDAGNAAAVAALLIPKFDTLNTTADAGLTFAEFVAGLGPQYAAVARDASITGGINANVSGGVNANVTNSSLSTQDSLTRDRLANIFSLIDADNDQIISKSEAIRAATDGVQSNTGVLGNVVNNTGATAERLTLTSSNSVGHEMQWHSQLLDLMNKHLAGVVTTSHPGAVTGLSTGGGAPGIPGTVANNMLGALNKIVVNTAATAYNTAFSGNFEAIGSARWGIYAAGGIAHPGQPIIYGEHHPQGPFFARVGSDPIAITPAMPSFRGGANDNSALIAELRAVKAELAALQRVVAGSGANVARAVIEGTDKVADKVDDQTGALASQERQINRQRKVA